MNRSDGIVHDRPTRFDLREPFVGLLDAVINIQHQYESRTSVEQRKAKGQYFTPAEVCSFMAGLFSEPKGNHYRFLDPGAGVGSLSAALCERLSRATQRLDIEAVLFENDRQVLPYLHRTMEHCRKELERAGHKLTLSLHEHDFILDAASSAQGNRGLFDENVEIGEVDAVIMNPPYFKLNKNSEYAKVDAVVHGQPNIYAFFLAAAAQMLRPGAELVAITPRSFFNGLYFRGFRQWFFGQMELDHIHLFESRTDTSAMCCKRAWSRDRTGWGVHLAGSRLARAMVAIWRITAWRIRSRRQIS